MNSEAERQTIFGDKYPFELQKRYAQLLLELESLNRHLDRHINGIAEHQQNLLNEVTDLTIANRPEALRKLSYSHATQVVKHCNAQIGAKSRPALDLVAKLVALLLQIRSLTAGGQAAPQAFELNAINDSLEDLARQILPMNMDVYQDSVEVHMSHFITGMSQSAMMMSAGSMYSTQ